MPLYLIAADLDAYEAAQRARLDLQARYEIALDAADELAMRRVKKLAEEYDLRHPDEPPLAAELDGFDYPAAA
ncbi:hypothetical protein [Streptomyces mirabilis]|jgi:hypothetical protein|uniref:hypothetical protein n=1 Tax=Streptomyces mirabilis TaxID=68239 RepID=UPI003405D0D1